MSDDTGEGIISPDVITRQQLDPASSVSGYRSTVLLVYLSIGWALLLTILGGAVTEGSVLAAVQLLLLVAGGTVVIRSSNPFRAPFTTRAHAIVHVLLVVACFVGAAAGEPAATFVRDDWVPTSLGLLVVAMGPYRPARELVAFSSLSTVFVAFATLVAVGDPDPAVPPAVYLLVSITPLLALGLGTATYTREVTVALSDWYRRTEMATKALADDLLAGIARSVQQDRLTVLGRDVSPFFDGLLASDRITVQDRDRAHEIAEALRASMVADAERSWLAALIIRAQRSGHPFDDLDDLDRVAGQMNQSQRTALRAFMVALDESPGGLTHGSITLTSTGPATSGELRLSSTADPHLLQRHFAPYLAVMRLAFPASTAETIQNDLIVRFSYDHS